VSVTALIGLYSSVMGSGKTEMTNVLVNQHGYAPVKFAGTLKDMLRFLLTGALGISLEETFRYTDGDLKETPIPFFGMKSCRWMMQTLGTDWGRNLISPTIWIDVWKARVARLLKDGWRVVVDDMRFPNEHDAVRALGGVTVMVSRPGLVETTGHASEGLLDKFPFDHVLGNHGSLDEWRDLASRFHTRLTQVHSAA
jgi:hypothetical protein